MNEVFVFPASFAQQRLWFIDQLIPNHHFYNVVTALKLTGILNLNALENTINEIVRRHESLRTNFKLIEDKVVQLIVQERKISLPILSVTEAEATKQILSASEQPFDLSCESLIRVLLLRLNQTEHILLLNLHHIICDDWSMGVLIRELGILYTAFCENLPNPLPELPLQYADFSEWQHQYLQGVTLETYLTNIQKQLQNLSKLNLRSKRPTPFVQSYRGNVRYLELPPPLSTALKTLSTKHGVTLFMTLQAAFKTLLHRYTNQDDIVIGSPIANRNRSEIEGLIGFFVNTLVLRTDFSGNPTFSELLERVKKSTLETYSYQDLPFEKLVEHLHPERTLNNPLFQVVFALENSPMTTLELPGVKVEALNLEVKTTRFDLEFHLWDCENNFRSLWGGDRWQHSEGIRGLVVYNTDLWEADTISRMVEHFKNLLESIIANPNQRVGNIDFLTQAERELYSNDTFTQYQSDRCIHQLFEAQVNQTPESIAVNFAGKQLTYRELNNRSNQLADYLQQHGVIIESKVAICLEPSIEMIIAILAILKAGAAYLPLDPNNPIDRHSFILEDAGVSLLLTQEKFKASLPECNTICLDTNFFNSPLLTGEGLGVRETITSDNLAYIIYTSGSTGKPKGVEIFHKAVNRLVCNTNYITITPQDKIAFVSNISFDAATFEIFGALLNGAMLVGINRDILLSPHEFALFLQQQQITVLFLTTALFQNLARNVPTVRTSHGAEGTSAPVSSFTNLKYLLFGGEKVDPKWVRKVLKHGAPQQLIHVYGPTENTTFSSYYIVKEVSESADSIPIGKAIANTNIHILDKYWQPVPIGVVGEIYLSGDGLARGYLNRPELTAERFRDNKYQTGDLAIYLPNGDIEFIGRVDDQVKIRGYRIELKEIETILSQQVAEAVVIVSEEIPGEKHLIAYIVPHPQQEITNSQLREFLKQKLPSYMIPSAYVILDSLPITTNGKVNRHALPKVDTFNLYLEDNYIAARSEVEAKLVAIWAKILAREKVGVYDNFFELGGHSLLATQLVSRIRDVFKIELPLSTLFESPTVAGLAKYIETVKWALKSPMAASSMDNDREEVDF